MKKIQYTVGLIGICVLTTVFFSCENTNTFEIDHGSKRVEIKASSDVSGEIDLSALIYTVCLFRADVSDNKSVVNADYKLIERKDNLTKPQVDTYNFTVDNTGMEARQYSYQLFVHATPDIPETKVTDMITHISSIEDIEIAAIASGQRYLSLSKDNYCALKKLDPEDIYAGNYIIKVALKRIVGQLVFDIFKCDPDTKLPVNINTMYNSTLDRVNCIEIKASGITTSFKPFGHTFVKNEASTTSLLVYPKLRTDYSMDTSVQDPEIILPLLGKDNIANPGGGIRLFTNYLLPTGGFEGSSILKTNLTFHYYDTTPLYSSSLVAYDKREISLNIPSFGKELTVVENCYTVTNVRLINDRIIDMDVNALEDVGINIDWMRKK